MKKMRRTSNRAGRKNRAPTVKGRDQKEISAGKIQFAALPLVPPTDAALSASMEMKVPESLSLSVQLENGLTVADMLIVHLLRHYESLEDEQASTIGTQSLNLVAIAPKDNVGMSTEARANWAAYHLGRIAKAFNAESLPPATRQMLSEIEKASRLVVFSEDFFTSAEPEMQRHLACMMRHALAHEMKQPSTVRS